MGKAEGVRVSWVFKRHFLKRGGYGGVTEMTEKDPNFPIPLGQRFGGKKNERRMGGWLSKKLTLKKNV